jgi:hypothetical protein
MKCLFTLSLILNSTFFLACKEEERGGSSSSIDTTLSKSEHGTYDGTTFITNEQRITPDENSDATADGKASPFSMGELLSPEERDKGTLTYTEPIPTSGSSLTETNRLPSCADLEDTRYQLKNIPTLGGPASKYHVICAKFIFKNRDGKEEARYILIR